MFAALPQEEVRMNFAVRLAAIALLLAAPAQAQEAAKSPETEGHRNVEIATNLICDTQQQVERFVAIFDGNAETAINAVNKEAKSPHACVIATAAYVKGEELSAATAGNGAGTYKVMQITVVGVFTLDGFEAVQPAEFFSLAPAETPAETIGQRT
jgi:hypothetical protein